MAKQFVCDWFAVFRNGLKSVVCVDAGNLQVPEAHLQALKGLHIEHPTLQKYMTWRAGALSVASVFYTVMLATQFETMNATVDKKASMLTSFPAEIKYFAANLPTHLATAEVVQFGFQLVSLLLVFAAMFTWTRYRVSRLLIWLCWLFGFIAPFCVMMCYPYRQSVDWNDVTAYLCEQTVTASLTSLAENQNVFTGYAQMHTSANSAWFSDWSQGASNSTIGQFCSDQGEEWQNTWFGEEGQFTLFLDDMVSGCLVAGLLPFQGEVCTEKNCTIASCLAERVKTITEPTEVLVSSASHISAADMPVPRMMTSLRSSFLESTLMEDCPSDPDKATAACLCKAAAATSGEPMQVTCKAGDKCTTAPSPTTKIDGKSTVVCCEGAGGFTEAFTNMRAGSCKSLFDACADDPDCDDENNQESQLTKDAMDDSIGGCSTKCGNEMMKCLVNYKAANGVNAQLIAAYECILSPGHGTNDATDGTDDGTNEPTDSAGDGTKDPTQPTGGGATTTTKPGGGTAGNPGGEANGGNPDDGYDDYGDDEAHWQEPGHKKPPDDRDALDDEDREESFNEVMRERFEESQDTGFSPEVGWFTTAAAALACDNSVWDCSSDDVSDGECRMECLTSECIYDGLDCCTLYDIDCEDKRLMEALAKAVRAGTFEPEALHVFDLPEGSKRQGELSQQFKIPAESMAKTDWNDMDDDDKAFLKGTPEETNIKFSEKTLSIAKTLLQNLTVSTPKDLVISLQKKVLAMKTTVKARVSQALKKAVADVNSGATTVNGGGRRLSCSTSDGEITAEETKAIIDAAKLAIETEIGKQLKERVDPMIPQGMAVGLKDALTLVREVSSKSTSVYGKAEYLLGTIMALYSLKTLFPLSLGVLSGISKGILNVRSLLPATVVGGYIETLVTLSALPLFWAYLSTVFQVVGVTTLVPAFLMLLCYIGMPGIRVFCYRNITDFSNGEAMTRVNRKISLVQNLLLITSLIMFVCYTQGKLVQSGNEEEFLKQIRAKQLFLWEVLGNKALVLCSLSLITCIAASDVIFTIEGAVAEHYRRLNATDTAKLNNVLVAWSAMNGKMTEENNDSVEMARAGSLGWAG